MAVYKSALTPSGRLYNPNLANTDTPVSTEDWKAGVNLPDNEGIYERAAAFDGHMFKVISMRGQDTWLVARHEQDFGTMVYFPIDRRTVEADWVGARYAYENETGDAWLPAHCHPSFHHDLELAIEADVVSLFEHEFGSMQENIFAQISSLARNPDDNNIRQRELASRVAFNILLNFRLAVVDNAQKLARKNYIGWHHRNPNVSSLFYYIWESFRTTKQDYIKEDTAHWARIRPVVERIITRLEDRHSYETRWEQDARKKAEAEAAESED